MTTEKQWVDVCARVFLFSLSLRRPKMGNSEIKLQLCSNQSKLKLRKKKTQKDAAIKKKCKNLFVSLFCFDISFRLDIEQIDFHL